MQTYQLCLRSADIQRTDQYPPLGPLDHRQQFRLELFWRTQQGDFVPSGAKTWLRAAQRRREHFERRFAVYR